MRRRNLLIEGNRRRIRLEVKEYHINSNLLKSLVSSVSVSPIDISARQRSVQNPLDLLPHGREHVKVVIVLQVFPDVFHKFKLLSSFFDIFPSSTVLLLVPIPFFRFPFDH